MSTQNSAPSKGANRFPVTIRNGDVEAKIYRTPTRIRGSKYDTYTLCWHLNGRQRRRFSDLTEAKREGERIVREKALGTLAVSAISAVDRIALEGALAEMAKADGTATATVPRLIEAVRDYASARVALPKSATLAEAAKFFAERHPASMPRKTVAEVVAEFIADRQSAGCSEIHLRDLRIRLAQQFATAFAVRMGALTAPLVQTYIYGLKNTRTGKPASNRSKENMLRCVVSLANFARRMKYIPAELALELSEIPTPKKQPSSIGIYTPGEITKLLAAADSEIIPALAIAAFAGLRMSEVSRLDWRDIRLGQKVVVVEANKAKTAARRIVKITDNLAAWLAPHVRPFGSLNPSAEATSNVGTALGDRLERAARRAGVKWKRNGFRHSYISYRVATSKNVAEVALECGNSPAVIYSSYRELAIEEEGDAWFAVMPPPSESNVIPMAAVSA
jgi:integrase